MTSGDSEPEPWAEQPPLVEGLLDPRPLGRGGFGTVYRAWQVGIGREVALKVGGHVLSGERDRHRFLREANAAGRLSSHSHIVAVYGAGVADDGRPYLIMELCSGGSLAGRLRADGPLPADEVRSIGIAIADALATAHAAGVLHRDVKPDNILVDEYEVAKLADFGLAAVLDASGDSSVTREALTPAYAPPEAFAYARPTARLDVYSLAATLYALLAGRPPRIPSWPPASLTELITGLCAPVPPVPGVHPDLLAVLARALDPEPDSRTASAAVLRDELRALPAAGVAGGPGGFGPGVPGVAGGSGPGVPAAAVGIPAGVSETLPSLIAPTPTPTPDQPPTPVADGLAVAGRSVDGSGAGGAGVEGPDATGAGAAEAATGAAPAELPAAGGAVRVAPPGAEPPGAEPRRRGSRSRRRLAVAATAVLVVAVIIAVTLLHRGDAPGAASAGPTAPPATSAAPTPTPPGPGRTATRLPSPQGGRSVGAPPGGSGGPRASGGPAGTSANPPATSRPTGIPPTGIPPTPPAEQPGGSGLPPGLVACSGSGGDVLCPTTPTCWDVVVPVGGSESAPPPEGCSQQHRVEAYAAGRIPAGGNPTPVMAHACTPSRKRARAIGDVKSWKSDHQQRLIPGYGWFFFCVAGPKDGSAATRQAFVTGP